jgi:ABC-type dipeptide/oligopeptide/nickel transport system permease subunit
LVDLADGETLAGLRVSVAALVNAEAPLRQSWRRFRRHHAALVGLMFLLLLLAVAIFAPYISRYNYAALVGSPLKGVSSEHWMGTDSLGRDLWSRVVYGSRISLEIAFESQAIALTIGLLLGSIAGWWGGVVGALIMRITDVALALPPILTALLFLSVFGNSATVLAIAIGLATWPILVRLVRGQTLVIKESEFIEAARCLGSSGSRTLRTHVIPNVLGVAIVQVTFGMSQAIFAEAFLSFIGLGPAPPSPTWGRLVSDGFDYIRVAPHLVVFPVLAIAATVLSLNFVGDGLRDSLDRTSDS